MNRTGYVCLMAEYNKRMNTRIYDAAGRLSADALGAHRGAFFGSILGTLNHLIVADTIWLKRFALHPADHVALAPIHALSLPTSLDQVVCNELESLAQRRSLLDQIIIDWSKSVVEIDLDHILVYGTLKGLRAQKNFFSLLMHFFNHQTHHRGQTSTLLMQASIDIGVTDLMQLIPDECL
ncbi:MAG: DinB family protein [Pseudomonadota bacterium]